MIAELPEMLTPSQWNQRKMPTTNPGDVVVVGVRRKKNFDIPNIDEEVQVDPDGEYNGGSGGWTQQEIDEENKRQENCAATGAGEKITAKSDSNCKEYLSHVYKAGDTTAYHAPRGGTGIGLSEGQFASARTEFNIQPWDIRGIVHNHPASYYCDGIEYKDAPFSQDWANRQTAFNQYPSENDWANAQLMVETYQYPSDLTLYIVGCDGVTRGFHYSEMAALRPLVQELNMLNGTVPSLQPPADCPQ